MSWLPPWQQPWQTSLELSCCTLGWSSMPLWPLERVWTSSWPKKALSWGHAQPGTTRRSSVKWGTDTAGDMKPFVEGGGRGKVQATKQAGEVEESCVGWLSNSRPPLHLPCDQRVNLPFHPGGGELLSLSSENHHVLHTCTRWVGERDTVLQNDGRRHCTV